MRKTLNSWQQFSRKLVGASLFEQSIIGLILLNALILGLETDAALETRFGAWFELGHQLILAAFIIEALLKISAVAPRFRLYFGNGWNLFDFSVIVLSLLPATGELAMVARLARLLRVLRLISTIPELRLIVATLMRSIPSMGNIMLLMSIIFYIYAIAGFHLFHQHDPEHWGSLGLALLTLFRVVTLEDWTDVMYTAMEVQPWAWLYFVSFVIMGTFVIINLFIAVVINNLEEAKAERLAALRQPVSRDELLKELENTQQAMLRLQKQMENMK
ncbi:ion transporter [Thiolapillus sp.]